MEVCFLLQLLMDTFFSSLLTSIYFRLTSSEDVKSNLYCNSLMKVKVTVWTPERQWVYCQRRVWVWSKEDLVLTYKVNMYTRKSKGPRKCSPRAQRTLPQHSLKNVTNDYLFTSETGMPVDYAMPKAEHNRPSNSRAQKAELIRQANL